VLDNVARDGERVCVVVGKVIGDARLAAMEVGAAELLGRDDLAGGGLDEWGTAEEDGAIALDNDGLVGHRGHVGAASSAGAHDDGDLRNATLRHVGLVEKDATKVVTVGKDVGLTRQEGAARVDEIDAGEAILQSDLLGAEVLLDGERIVGAALDSGVVGNNDTFAAVNAANAGDDAGGRHPVVVVALVGGELREFEERSITIDQSVNTL
jgi:hypothetical protein